MSRSEGVEGGSGSGSRGVPAGEGGGQQRGGGVYPRRPRLLNLLLTISLHSISKYHTLTIVKSLNQWIDVDQCIITALAGSKVVSKIISSTEF